jgi:hypothetical protein
MARTRNTDSITGSRSEGSHPDGARAHTPTQMADVSHTYAHVPPPPPSGASPLNMPTPTHAQVHAHTRTYPPAPTTAPRPFPHTPSHKSIRPHSHTPTHDTPTDTKRASMHGTLKANSKQGGWQPVVG